MQWSEVQALSKTNFCGNVQDTLLITGTNFINVDSVVLNNSALSYSVLNATTIQVIIPVGASSGELFVHTKQGVSKSDPISVQNNSLALTVDSNTITANYSGNVNQSNWIWFNCANNDTISTSANTTLTVSEVGFYALTVEENACVLTTPCETVTNIPDTNTFTPIDTLVIPPDTIINEDSTTAIRNINNAAFVRVYPNPTSNKVFISSLETNLTHLAVYSMTGKLILSTDLNTKKTEISFSELPKGVYLLKVMSDSKVNTYKVVRE
ncbi:MAG: T9SS type A sorting domain-containing protein [Chitinophagales bacterium]